ncbi:MAG: trypsin-like peptidase domain-containing protein [Calditrichaceae bacterium]|nr:trypsin-like peptidase domain-containing protein [Calditrichaceae bacterium]
MIYRLTVFCLFLLPSYLLFADITGEILQAKNKVFPALVHVQPIKEIFSSGDKRKVQVTGSGIIISADGYVVTNNHVAEQARFVRCTLSSKIELDAEVVGLDAWTDLAVLKLDLAGAGLKSVPFVKLGDSDQLEVGQIVLALGSPLGLSRSLSMGVVSSIDRYFDDMGEMTSPFNLWIQTDAAINPGNSGGPLVNLDGQVIGINARAFMFGENLGFAIPSNTVDYVVKQIIKTGEVERSWIGIEWQEIKEYRKYKKDESLNGVLIASVEKNSPAEKAGLKPGYLVKTINGKPVTALYQEELPPLRLLIANLPVNSMIAFNVKTDDGDRKFKLVTDKQGKFSGNEFHCDAWGFSVEELTPRIKKIFQLESDNGVLISGVRRGGPADESDIRRGHILLKIDEEEIINLDDFKQKYQAMKENPARDHLLYLRFINRNWFALIKGTAL